MKKILLPIMALLFTATVANAQETSTNEGKTYLAAHGVVTETTGDATKIIGADDIYDFYVNLYGMDMDAVFVRFTTEDLEPYVGYNVVGMSVAGVFGGETTDFMLNIECNQTFNEKEELSSKM